MDECIKAMVCQPNTVVHCETEQDAQTLLNWASSVGLTWAGGDFYSVSNTWYWAYKEHTCYDLHEGQYASIEYCEEHGYTIIPFAALGL